MPDKSPTAIYIHWPYCARICPYCDFNVYKDRADDQLLDAIIKDLSAWSDWLGERAITSIHFGGGTPSLLSAADIARVIGAVSGQSWSLAADCEIALEANPMDAGGAVWRDYAAAGITRLSLGVQTFYDPALKFLGRDHDAAQARCALDLAQDIFPSVSLDLIFGWAGQTAAQWQGDIDIALAASPPHISAYQLTIEPGTAFGRAAGRGQRRAVNEDSSAQFYDMARLAFTAAGYAHYEISNFAKPGHRSKHNLAYWQGRDYVGVGPGAHGRATVDGSRFATIAHKRPKDYIEALGRGGLGAADKQALSSADWAEEYVLMGLRKSDGLSLAQLAQIAGAPLDPARYQGFIDEGYMAQDGDRLAVTEKGRPVLDYLTTRLLTWS